MSVTLSLIISSFPAVSFVRLMNCSQSMSQNYFLTRKFSDRLKWTFYKSWYILCFFFNIYFYLFTYLVALGLGCNRQDLFSCGMWDLVPWQGSSQGPLHWELSLSHCTTRDAPRLGTLMYRMFFPQSNIFFSLFFDQFINSSIWPCNMLSFPFAEVYPLNVHVLY